MPTLLNGNNTCTKEMVGGGVIRTCLDGNTTIPPIQYKHAPTLWQPEQSITSICEGEQVAQTGSPVASQGHHTHLYRTILPNLQRRKKKQPEPVHFGKCRSSRVRPSL